VDSPLAYFLTWSTYATWLHGDPRGSVDHSHRAFDSPRLEPNERTLQRDAASTKEIPLFLAPRDRRAVHDAIEEHARIKGWTIHALNVRSNHVHLVITAPLAPEPVMTQCKAWSTRRLREKRFVDLDAKVWTKHGSTHYLWSRDSIVAAMRYTLEQQDIRPALPLGPLKDRS